MRLKRIRLRRVPGIDPEFTLEDLCDGINVVVGPNGSGKTSVCKAMAATLWPSRDTSKKLEIETLWQQGGHLLSAERDGVRVKWQCDAAPTEPPSLPDHSLSACYTMGVRDLLVGGDGTDDEIAREIRVQMSGGYDLNAVVAKRFTLPPHFGRRERSERDAAETKLASVRKAFRDLACEEDLLEEMLTAEAEAKAAQAEVGRLERAVDLAEARLALAANQDELAGFPAGMDALRAEDLTTLAELEEKRDQARSEVARNTDKLEQALAAIKTSGLAEARPDETQLEAGLERLGRAENLARDITGAEEQRAVAHARLERARESLGANDAAPFANLSSQALEHAESLLRRADKLRDKYSGLRAQIGLLRAAGEGEAVGDLAALTRASDTLRNWLASSARPDLGFPFWQAAVAVAALVLGTGLALEHNSAWMFFVGVAASTAVVGLVVRIRRLGNAAAKERRHCEWEFEQIGVADAPEWQPGAVRAALRRLDEHCTRARDAEHRNSQLAMLRQRLGDLEREEARLLAAREALRDELGMDVDCGIDSDLTLSVLARRWRECDEAAAAAAEAEARIETLGAEFREIRAGLVAFLGRYGQTCGDDLREIRSRLGALQRRLRDYERACEQRAEASRQRDRASGEERAALARIEEFYEERHLEGDRRRGLEERLRQLDRYLDICGQCEYQSKLVRQGELRLADHARLLGLSKEEAQSRLQQARDDAESLGRISTEIGSIRGRIARAGEQTELESAQAELIEADDRLAEVCERARAAAAGAFLLADVDREHERESRPAVLARAMEYFAAFTHNAYELLLTDEQGARFRARDTSSGQGLELSQLSEGTRIQLLLAVRVAFAISAERGSRLPLVFDEVLSTADPQRFDAIAESLCVLASEGRQIFYMTSNPADVARWQLVCRAKSAAKLMIVDLAEIRGLQAAVKDVAAIGIPELPGVPSPDGMTPEEYAVKLRVPTVDPYANFTQLHLFYVLRHDLGTLHRLIREYRLTTVGEWCSLSNSGRAERLLGARLCARVDALCVCAAAVYEAWRVGRGKPVSRGVLEESGAVSDTYIDRIVDLSRDLGGDAERLIAAIGERSDERARGFRAGSLDALKGYLEDRGYIDHSPVLDVPSIYSRSLDAAHEAVKAEVIEESECTMLVEGLLAILERRGSERANWQAHART